MPSDDKNPSAAGRRAFIRATTIGTAGLLAGCGVPNSSSDGGAPDGSPGRDADGPMDASTDSGPDAGPDAGPRPVIEPELTPEVDEFAIGIASGDVTHEQAVLWTRHDGTDALRLSVWRMDGARYESLLFEEDVIAAEGGFIHRLVENLEAGRYYRYVFYVLEDDAPRGRSPIGRFRAAIAPDDLSPLKVGAISCSKNGLNFAPLERLGEREDLDVIMMLGDTTYNDGDRSVAQFRASWSQNLRTLGYRKMRESTSVLATWDDHEVDNDFDPQEWDLTVPRDAFFDHLPLERPRAHPNRIWRSKRWGLTAEIFMLDCRSERDAGAGLYISDEQMQWLKQSLADSPCAFKIIGNSVPITDFPVLFPLARDRWEGTPAQRREILSFIDDNAVSGVLWVAGDVHFPAAMRVSDSGVGSRQIEVLAGPIAQSIGNPAAQTLRFQDQYHWFGSTYNYLTLELEPRSTTVRCIWTNGSGTDFHTEEYDLS